MSVLERARQDLRTITNGGWSSPCLFEAPTGETASIRGIYNEHTEQVLTNDGNNQVSSLQANVKIFEKDLTDLGYPTRNDEGLVHLDGHFCTATNAAGQTLKYKVKNWRPDQMLGGIQIMLESYTE